MKLSTRNLSTRNLSTRAARWVGFGICLFCLPALWVAAERVASAARRGRAPVAAAPANNSTVSSQSTAASQSGKSEVPLRSVELFAGIKSGDIEVKFIPKDDTEARVLITNKTKQPLHVSLPDAFAGVPVLAQLGGAGGRGGGANNMMGGMNQGMGGGMGGMGGGMGGGGMGGMGGGMFSVPDENDAKPTPITGTGFINVPAEKTSQFKVAAVCLEHGKRNPSAKVPYEIVPIDRFTTKPGVAEMLTQFGNGKFDQRATQAAAWHLNNGMSWEQLAAKRIEHIGGGSSPYFSAEQISAGMEIAAAAKEAAQQRPVQTPGERSPGEQASIPAGQAGGK
jgi:hypothetical protein